MISSSSNIITNSSSVPWIPGNLVTAANIVTTLDSTGRLNNNNEQHPNLTNSLNRNCWPDDATSILFQLAHICLLIAYLAPGGKYCLLFIHFVLALAHLLIIIWVSNICFTIASLLGWSVTFLGVNVLRVAIQLYITRHVKFAKELEEIYEQLFGSIGVSRTEFKKLVAQGKLLNLHSGEAYAIEKVTPTDRLSLLITGKNHFLHSIKPGEFLDSPEWESGGIGSTTKYNDVFVSTNNNSYPKRNIHFKEKNNRSTTDQKNQLIFNMEVIQSTDHEPSAADGSTDNRFNVSLIAATQCRIISWNRVPLEYYLAKDKHILKVLDLILGRDITNKLYAMNHRIISDKGSMLDIRLPVIITSLTKHLEHKRTISNEPSSSSTSTIQKNKNQNHWIEEKNQTRILNQEINNDPSMFNDRPPTTTNLSRNPSWLPMKLLMDHQQPSTSTTKH